MTSGSSPRAGQVTQRGPIREGAVLAVLRGLYVGRRTGTLTFARGEERRGVHLRHGTIVNADTNVREDRLGAVLVREGRLSDTDRKRAEGFALRDRKRLGAVLLELGLLDRAGLEEALALHVDAVLSRVFEWSEGQYEFCLLEDLPLLEDEVTLRVSTGELILQAARGVRDPEVVRHHLGDLDRVLLVSSDPLLRFQKVRLTPLDGFVMSRVDGTLTARDVIGLIPSPGEEVEHSLFALISAGLVEFRAAEPRNRPRPVAAPKSAEPTRAAEDSPSAPARDDATVEMSPQTLARLTDLARRAHVEQSSPDPTVVIDPEELAKIPMTRGTDAAAEETPEAETAEEEAGVDPTIVMAPPEFSAPGIAPGEGGPLVPSHATEEPPPVDPTVVMSGAFEPLSSAELRRREIVMLHQSLGTRSHFDLLGVPRDATEAQVREAYFRLARQFHPDGQHEPELSGLRDALEAIFRRLGEAYEVLRNPRIRAVYERNLNRGLAAGGGGATPAAGVESPAEALLARAAESFAAERYWEVIQVLEKSVSRFEGEHKQRGRVLLARAYAKTPDWVKQGEELLVAVVQQDPNDAEAHFHLGVLYRGQGLRNRALSAFRRVVELVPDHAEARHQLEELRSLPSPR